MDDTMTQGGAPSGLAKMLARSTHDLGELSAEERPALIAL